MFNNAREGRRLNIEESGIKNLVDNDAQTCIQEFHR